MKISVRWVLIFGIAGLIWLTQGVILLSNRFSSEKVFTEHARDIISNIAQMAELQARRELQAAQGVVHLTKRLLISEVLGGLPERHQAVENYFLEQLSVNRHFDGLYFGRPNGDFIIVHRSGDRSAEGYRTKIVTHGVDGRKSTLHWRDQDRRLVATEEEPHDTYDPRARSWYMKAAELKTLIWTDPYLFYTTQRLGITVAEPIFDQDRRLLGIVGLDIEIEQLSDLIDRIQIARNGRAFLFNSNGDLLATPDGRQFEIAPVEGQPATRLRKIGELTDGPIRAAYDALNRKPGADGRLFLERAIFVRFLYEGEPFYAVFTPLVNDQWPWIIGGYVPESDLLGNITATRRHDALVTLAFSLAATLLGLWLARGIIRPLSGLTQEARAVKQSDFNRRFDTDSMFKEFQETADSFERMKEALRTSEDKYRRIFENIQDVYFETLRDGTLLEISPSIETLTGYHRQALLGVSVRTLCADPVEYIKFEQAIAYSGQVNDFELAIRTPDGSKEYCSITARLKRDAEGRAEKMIGSLRVVSDRKKADIELYDYKVRLEELVRERTLALEKTNDQLRSEIDIRREKENELRWSEEKYRTIIESLDCGYYESDREGNLTFYNRSLWELLGCTPQEMEGVSLLRHLEPPEGRELAEILRNMQPNGDPPKPAIFHLTPKSGPRRTVEISAAPVLDGHQQVVGARGLVQDITDRVNADAEKKKLEERFQQIHRLEGIGTLAGGVAHDFNNLMMGIQGNVSLILMEIDKESANYERLKNIEANVTTGAELTRQLLGFARGGKYMVKPMEVNPLVSKSARLFGRTRKEISIVEKLQKDAWQVNVDRSQIELVLFNLFINSWQAMPEGGNIYIETANVMLEKGEALSPQIDAGRYVRISIADTGTGMDEPTQKRLFEPFFTTKDIGRGTGLGLASAYGIIKNHGGAIDFASTLGQGTVFHIYLPAHNGPTPKVSTPTPPAPAKGSGKVLMVDDEAMVLKTGRWMLEKLGYQALTAQNGPAAIELFTQQNQEIAMVILDMVMPEMDGYTLFYRLRQIAPSVKVLISTGYDHNDKIEEMLSHGCTGYIQKPFHIDRLSNKMREILDTPN